MSKSPPPLRLFLIFLTLSALHFFSMFYRFSNAVISPDLVKDLGLNAETLGILGGAFFYSFTLLQIPMGPMLDRIGPRIVVSAILIHRGIGRIPLCLWKFIFHGLLGKDSDRSRNVLCTDGLDEGLYPLFPSGEICNPRQHPPIHRNAWEHLCGLSLGLFHFCPSGGEPCSFLPAQ